MLEQYTKALQPADSWQPKGWTNAVCPDEAQCEYLKEKGVPASFLEASLDPEETSRIDKENNALLLIADFPVEEEDAFVTCPLGIVLLSDQVVTISSRPCPSLTDLHGDAGRQTQFLLKVLLGILQSYQGFLAAISRQNDQIERRLYAKMENKDLMRMLNLEKSLVYFSTSLKGMENMLQRLMRGRTLPMYEEDRDLLDDVMIELRQDLEMSQVYSDIISRTMEGFSNVINNNMNLIMKKLTILTIVLSIPNIIYGFYGMNVEGLPIPVMWFPLLISLLGCIGAWMYFKRM